MTRTSSQNQVRSGAAQVASACRRPSTWLWVAALLVVWPQPWHQLRVSTDFMIDLHVYRDAGVSLLHHHPVYSHYTLTHANLLPFTYPPVAALLAVPLAVLPLTVVGLLWDIAVYATLIWLLRLLLVPVRGRVRVQRPALEPWLLPTSFVVCSYLLPGREQVHFGQVGLFLLALIAVDLLTPHTGRWRGVLVGLATAIKLTPGVFIVALFFAGRRRAAAIATASFAGVSLLAALAAPGSSKDYWTSALFDSNRLGNNADPTNQSLRGLILRTPLHHLSATLVFLAAATTVGVIGLVAAVRKARDGDELAVVTVVGLLSCLLSPVAWVHHYVYLFPLLAMLVRDGRFRVAAGLSVLWLVNWPGVAAHWASRPGVQALFGTLLQDSLGLSMVAVVGWLALNRGGQKDQRKRREGHASHTLQQA